ncbi:hypothetical protein NGB36_32860, partial [Streptomyces sp. RB6PN25]
TEKVAATSQKLGQAMYAQTQTQTQTQAGGDGAGAHEAKEEAGEDVVDAEIVDDDKSQGGTR